MSNPFGGKHDYNYIGQLSKTAAKRIESPLYGSNTLLPFTTEAAYLKKIAQLRKQGYTVYDD